MKGYHLYTDPPVENAIELQRFVKWIPSSPAQVQSFHVRSFSFFSCVFETFLPWKEHLFELEEEQPQTITPDNRPIYVIYPDESGKWRVQAVPVAPESFESRKALPEVWRGLRDDDLSKASGVDGCVFVHASGFIGGKIRLWGSDSILTFYANRQQDQGGCPEAC